VVTLSLMAFGQTPARRNDLQVYGGGGIGFYDDADSGPSSAKILGAGVKLPLAGPLKLRVDYRLFLGEASASSAVSKSIHAQRLSAGISLYF